VDLVVAHFYLGHFKKLRIIIIIIIMSLTSNKEIGVSGVSARMSRGCYEETAVVEFRLYHGQRGQRFT